MYENIGENTVLAGQFIPQKTAPAHSLLLKTFTLYTGLVTSVFLIDLLEYRVFASSIVHIV